MRNIIAHPMSWAFAGVVFMFASIAASDSSVSPEQLEPVAPVAETAPATPYAHAMWVKLGDLVLTEAASGDVYVRLIAIDGEVPFPVDHDR